MRIVVMFFYTFLMLFGLLGCQENDSPIFDNNEVKKIEVSKSQGFGKVNSEIQDTFKNKDSLISIINAIENAEKSEREINMAHPDFDLQIIFKDSSSKGYHLFINKDSDNAFIMDIEHTNKIFKLTQESTKQLKELFNLGG